MTPVSSQIMQALETRLQGIAVSAGYLTDLGISLLVGWPQHLLANQQASLPLMALHPGSDGVDSAQRGNQLASRAIVVELIADQHDTAPAYLDQALYDIRRALVGLEREVARVITVIQGRAVWDQPDESGALVRLTVPITITYTDSYGG